MQRADFWQNNKLRVLQITDKKHKVAVLGRTVSCGEGCVEKCELIWTLDPIDVLCFCQLNIKKGSRDPDQRKLGMRCTLFVN